MAPNQNKIAKRTTNKDNYQREEDFPSQGREHPPPSVLRTLCNMC